MGRLLKVAVMTALTVLACAACIVDGTYQVGYGKGQVAPGLYRSMGAKEEGGFGDCYWERDRSFSGQIDDIIANDNVGIGEPTYVEIGVHDAGFQSNGCGFWIEASKAVPQVRPGRPFGNGMYRLGPELIGGTYKSTGGPNCYWARLTNASGQTEAIIANDNVSGPAIVTISGHDGFFESKDCGIWTKIG